ncbi:MAG TPA: TIGR02281 family clan AA aspartic protease [Xanthobacteraceae bacterium]|nr:TIGR02281 family clan AA aspartic protease [Xanthobacteraceae bacterium]
MRNIIVFAVVALVAAVLAPRYFERMAAAPPVPSRAPAVPAPATAAPTVAAAPVYSGGGRTVEIRRDERGHFAVDGAVDGRRIGFMVDTGASVVALTERDASRLGYHPVPRDYVVQVRTANGAVRAAPVKLDMVEVGGVMVRNVDAIVMPDQALGENLLGLSFLSRLRRFEYREGRLVLEE